MVKAYLTAKLEILDGNSQPVLTRMDIFSDACPTGKLKKEFFAHVLVMEGSSYSEARQKIVDFVHKTPGWEWCAEWFKETSIFCNDRRAQLVQRIHDREALIHNAEAYFQSLQNLFKD